MIKVQATAVLILCGCAPLASAWGPQGHRTVGAIADRLLSAPARAQVAALLADDRDKFDRLSGRTTLESVSVWADEIRGTPLDHPAWHYDNRPVCGSAPQARYCPGGECNSVQLERLTTVLADRHAAQRERNEALKWVVHLAGDLHQPLHAADNDDHGGNQVAVALAGVHTRGRETLHRAWDSEFVRQALRTDRPRPPADVEGAAAAAQRLWAVAGQGSPDVWAHESNARAREVAYTYPGFVCHRPPDGIVVLDAAYQKAAAAVARDRLLLAGARLATLLNRVLATAPSNPR